MADPLSELPDRVTQGDTYSVQISGGDEPPTDGWALAYQFTSLDGSEQLAIDATADGPDWLLEVDDTEAAKFTGTGTYLWREVATKAATAETRTRARGRVQVLDPFTGAGDRRTHVERVLALLEARIEGRATAQTLSTAVEGRSLSLWSIQETLDARARYQAELEQILHEEALENGHTRSNAVRVRLRG